jgi:hypothetical protein
MPELEYRQRSPWILGAPQSGALVADFDPQRIKKHLSLSET